MQLSGRMSGAVSVVIMALALGGCSSTTSDDKNDKKTPRPDLSIVTSYYPLEYVTQRIAAGRAQVTSLTPPGAEPHDLPMTDERQKAVTDADLVIYLSEQFQPAVAAAVTSAAGDHALDVVPAAQLTHALASAETVPGGEPDPHFWLAPIRLNGVSQLIAQRLSRLDPDGASTYAQNAEALGDDLTTLDSEYAQGLAHCSVPWVVTGHSAFYYLASHHGLTNVSLSWNPIDDGPGAGLASVTQFLASTPVPVMYTEPLVRPDAIEALARRFGARTMVLDPIEAITPAAAGSDYLSIMRTNLQTLRAGQECR